MSYPTPSSDGVPGQLVQTPHLFVLRVAIDRVTQIVGYATGVDRDGEPDARPVGAVYDLSDGKHRPIRCGLLRTGDTIGDFFLSMEDAEAAYRSQA